MACQDRSAEVVEAPAAGFAAVTLTLALGVVVSVPDDRLTRAVRAAHAVGPTMLADEREALGVVDERREVDRFRGGHGNTESVGN